MILTSSTTSHAFLQATEILMSQPVVPPSGSFVVILFFIVGCQERDCGQVFILCSNASNDTKSMNLTVYTRAAALFYCNLDVSVILWGKTKFELTQRAKTFITSCCQLLEVLNQPTSVQSLRRSTVVSVGLMLIVFSSIKLFKELPPVY